MTKYQKNILLKILNNSHYIGIKKTKQGYEHYLIKGNKRERIKSSTSKAINRFLHSLIKTAL